jgi:8-oxo-dGTP diphosphatase
VSNEKPNHIVVAGALISGTSLLVAQRARPPELAGLWELPGGKVAAGESDAAALARELREELGVEVVVGSRIGADVALNATTTLRAYRVTQTGGALHANDHRALRWITLDELDGLPWVPADREWLPELTRVLTTTDLTVRKATENDRAGIARVIAYAYRREFSTVTKDLEKVARALGHAVQIDRFFVAERGGDVVGTIACTDCTGRAMRASGTELRRHLGLVRGTLFVRSVVPEFSPASGRYPQSRLDYPATAGYIEFVAVAEKVRRQGVATKLVEGVIAQTSYTDYVLEVTDANTPARDCYRKIGFVDIKSKKEKFGRLKGFRERIYMRYPG